jgi:hypothetical protein
MVSSGKYTVGSRVRVTQQIPFAKKSLATTIEGTIQRFGQQKTGSWFAHAKDDKLWLDRLELRKDDGEIVYVNLDQYSVVEAV